MTHFADTATLTREEVANYIVQAIEAGEGRPENFDLEQIVDGVASWTPTLGGYVLTEDNELFWDEVEKGAWDSGYKENLAQSFPDAADDILGRSR